MSDPTGGLAAKHTHEVRHIVRWFGYDHLPTGAPRDASMLFAGLAGTLLQTLPPGEPEVAAALRHLLAAKDAAVRAAVAVGLGERARAEATDLIRALYAEPWGTVGGPLHIVTDDLNCDDESLDYCRANVEDWFAAGYHADPGPEARALCVGILDRLDLMTEAVRMDVCRDA